MEKLSHHSADSTQQNIEKIAQLFPHVVTETQVDGRVELGVDFEALKQELSDIFIEPATERYGLSWPGKRQAQFIAHQPVAKTLRPDREESVNFDTTKNLFIEGDNLDALKLLQNSYTGKIKLIYIDPPYNTGNDFVYNDDFAENRDEYLLRSGAESESGQRFVTNPETNGRFHSDWLSMMYPRLQLAKKLLSEDGLLFVSISDQEVANLRLILDEIFGPNNFEGHIHWRRRHNQPNDKTKLIGIVAEHILVFSKNSSYLKIAGIGKLPLTGKFSNPDNDPKGNWNSKPWKAGSDQQGSRYKIISPSGISFEETWMGNESNYKQLLNEGRIYFTKNGAGLPRKKIYMNERMSEGQCANNWFDHENFGHNQDGTGELEKIFSAKNLFSNPKPTKLLQKIIMLANLKDDDVVLDFFAGSASMADAVIKTNAEDGVARRFIMVQIPEDISSSNASTNFRYTKISELSRERIRRAANMIREDAETSVEELDLGFRALTVAPSNFAEVYIEPDNLEQADLPIHQGSLRQDRTAEDLIFEILLQLGEELSVPVESLPQFGEASVYSAAEKAIIGCFASTVTEDLVRQIATFAHEEMTQTVIFLDSALANDALLENIHQIFKQLAPEVSVKVI